MMKQLFFSLLLFTFFCFSIQAQSWLPTQKVTASVRLEDSYYGNSVSISGNSAMVGSYLWDYNSTTTWVGTVYVYEQDNGAWSESQQLLASDWSESDRFGNKVQMHNNLAIIGAYQRNSTIGDVWESGAAYIFEKQPDGNWIEKAKLEAPDPGYMAWFGISVDINDEYAVVGAVWNQLDANGANALPYSGGAYIYKRQPDGSWLLDSKIVANDRAQGAQFGSEVAISPNNTIAVGSWLEKTNATGGNSLDEAGAVYIFEKNSSTWTQTQKLVNSDRATGHYFGEELDIDNETLIISSRSHVSINGSTQWSAGACYVFKKNASSQWAETQKIYPATLLSNDGFGNGISLDGTKAVIGAYNHDYNASNTSSLFQAGAAYIFEENPNGQWIETQQIDASDREAYDYWGGEVAISGDNIIVGAESEDHDANGANYLSLAGSAYFFHYGTNTSVIPHHYISVTAYPNPTKDFIKVSTEAFGKYLSIQITNSLGEVISKDQIVNDQLTEIPLESPGMYMIRISDESGNETLFKAVR